MFCVLLGVFEGFPCFSPAEAPDNHIRLHRCHLEALHPGLDHGFWSMDQSAWNLDGSSYQIFIGIHCKSP